MRQSREFFWDMRTWLFPMLNNAGERAVHISCSSDIGKKCPLKAGNQRGTEVRSLVSETDIFRISSACGIISVALCG